MPTRLFLVIKTASKKKKKQQQTRLLQKPCMAAYKEKINFKMGIFFPCYLL